jgi:hypothetical protein
MYGQPMYGQPMYGQPWSMYTPQPYVPQPYPGVGGGHLAPQGFLGQPQIWPASRGPHSGADFGGLFGQPQIGSQLGQVLGGLGHLLPFQAIPGIPSVPWAGQPWYGGGQPWYGGGQVTPQGFLGNLLGQLAGPAGQAFGGLFGQPQIGSQLGQMLGGLGHLLPFQIMPLPIQAGLQSGMVPPYLGGHLPFQQFQPFQQPVPGVAPMIA